MAKGDKKTKPTKAAKKTKPPKVPKPKVTKEKVIKEKTSPDEFFKRLEDPDMFINIKKQAISFIPIKTQIGYIYRHSNGLLIPVISAFVQSHYIDTSGLHGMMIKCGNRTYANLYDSIEKIYIYKRDHEKVAKEMQMNLNRKSTKLSDEEMMIRIKRLEEQLAEFTTKLVRSTSVQQLAPKSIPPKVVKTRKPASITHEKKREKPLRF